MPVKPVPEGFHTVSPYLAVHGVPAVIEFLQKAFDAAVVHRHDTPDGRVMNASLKIGDSMVMMGELASDQEPWVAMLYLYVEDVDAVYRRAIEAGGKSVMEPADQFYGDRSGAVEDPSGSQWWIATHREDMSDEELIRRAQERGG